MYFGLDQLKKYWLDFWNWLLGKWNNVKLFWVKEGKPVEPKRRRRRRKPARRRHNKKSAVIAKKNNDKHEEHEDDEEEL